MTASDGAPEPVGLEDHQARAEPVTPPPAAEPDPERALARGVAPVVVPEAPVEPVAEVAPIRVSINATPWARIFVDGEDVGVTPLAGVELEVGARRFEARFPDGTVMERVQTVGPVNRWVVFP